MIGVQDQEQVQGVHKVGVHLISFAGRGEHHVQEVLAIGEVVFRIDEGLADGLLVPEGGDGGHFGKDAVDGQLLLLGTTGIERVLTIDGHGLTTELRMAMGWASGGKPA